MVGKADCAEDLGPDLDPSGPEHFDTNGTKMIIPASSSSF